MFGGGVVCVVGKGRGREGMCGRGKERGRKVCVVGGKGWGMCGGGGKGYVW